MQIARLAWFPIAATMLALLGACATDSAKRPSVPPTTKFDGKWDALMTSNQSPCPETHKYVVTVKNGKISGTVPGKLNDYDLDGSVAADGRIVDLEGWSAERRMTLDGKFDSTGAQGKYYVFGVTTNCGGAFKFTRR